MNYNQFTSEYISKCLKYPLYPLANKGEPLAQLSLVSAYLTEKNMAQAKYYFDLISAKEDFFKMIGLSKEYALMIEVINGFEED